MIFSSFYWDIWISSLQKFPQLSKNYSSLKPLEVKKLGVVLQEREVTSLTYFEIFLTISNNFLGLSCLSCSISVYHGQKEPRKVIVLLRGSRGVRWNYEWAGIYEPDGIIFWQLSSLCFCSVSVQTWNITVLCIFYFKPATAGLKSPIAKSSLSY